MADAFLHERAAGSLLALAKTALYGPLEVDQAFRKAISIDLR
jgi:hypothetical protein